MAITNQQPQDGTASEASLQITKVQSLAVTSQPQFDPPEDPRNRFLPPLQSMPSLRKAIKGTSPFLCPACHESITTKAQMDIHLSARHPGFMYRCPNVLNGTLLSIDWTTTLRLFTRALNISVRNVHMRQTIKTTRTNTSMWSIVVYATHV